VPAATVDVDIDEPRERREPTRVEQALAFVRRIANVG
jgi:hypothetical protein